MADKRPGGDRPGLATAVRPAPAADTGQLLGLLHSALHWEQLHLTLQKVNNNSNNDDNNDNKQAKKKNEKTFLLLFLSNVQEKP